MAARAVTSVPRRLLDIGSGIGSVGLLTLWSLLHSPDVLAGTVQGPEGAARAFIAPDADEALTVSGRNRGSPSLVGVEIQARSVHLARRTASLNGLDGLVEFRHGDLRDPSILAGEAPFALVTGSPPYFPPSRAVRSPHPQRAGARLELNGDVYDYCRVAAANLAPGGRFCFCHAAADERPEKAIEAAGLRVHVRQDVVFRHGAAPLIALFVCAFTGEREEREDRPPFHVRDADGRWTAEYLEMRRVMGTVVWNPGTSPHSSGSETACSRGG